MEEHIEIQQPPRAARNPNAAIFGLRWSPCRCLRCVYCGDHVNTERG